jgi:hypothetical protein
MTYLDEPEVRRPSRGAKVLGFGLAILAVLGSFWGIVWFIRSYVEPPRVMRPSPLALAARDSTPVTVSPQTRRIVPQRQAASRIAGLRSVRPHLRQRRLRSRRERLLPQRESSLR